MRLHKSQSAAEEELTELINEGYRVLQHIKSDYQEKKTQESFDKDKDPEQYRLVEGSVPGLQYLSIGIFFFT